MLALLCLSTGLVPQPPIKPNSRRAALVAGGSAFAIWRYRNRDTVSLLEQNLPEINIERERGGLEHAVIARVGRSGLE